MTPDEIVALENPKPKPRTVCFYSVILDEDQQGEVGLFLKGINSEGYSFQVSKSDILDPKGFTAVAAAIQTLMLPTMVYYAKKEEEDG